MTWTVETTEFVKAKWADGASASDIAAELGVTRNAVLGKIHRLRRGDGPKPDSRGSGTRHASELAKARAALFPFVARQKAVKEFEQRVGIPELPPDKSLHAVSFAKLDSMHCRWVLGEPSEQIYCGEDRKLGSSYCHRHHAIAYTSPDKPDKRVVWRDYHKRAA